MSKLILKNKSGFTLIEIMVGLAILSIVISVTYSLLFFGANSFSMNNRQYILQSDYRFAMDSIVKEVRFATSLELVDASEDVFTNTFEEGYNYFYINDGNLLHAVYNKDRGYHNTVIYAGHFKSESTLFKKLNSTTLSIDLKSKYDQYNQTYDNNTVVSLLNLNLNGDSILGLEGSGLKYSASKEMLSTVDPTPVPNSVTISFNTAGGSSIASIVQTSGTVLIPPVNPTKSGYIFDGWNPSLPTTMPSSNVILTALWKSSPEDDVSDGEDKESNQWDSNPSFPDWISSNNYVGGINVTYKGNRYTSKQWIDSNLKNPEENGLWVLQPLPNEDYPRWRSMESYAENTHVIHEGKIYKAKWWVNTSVEPPNSPWKLVK